MSYAKRSFKNNKKIIEGAGFFFSLIITLVFLTAAFGKLFFPNNRLATLDFWVALFEILFCIYLISFFRRWQTWSVALLLFAAWTGYSLFWLMADLPCSCMGTLVVLPTTFTFSLDFFFWLISLFLVIGLGAGKRGVAILLTLSILFAFGGYFIGKMVFQSLL